MTDREGKTVGREYVRLTFTPNGGRRRTVWGIKTGHGTYTVCDKHGQTLTDVGETIRKEVVVLDPEADSYTERPSRMSRHYGELEVVP